MIDPKGINTTSNLSFKTDAKLKKSQEDYYLSLKAKGFENKGKKKTKWAKHKDVKKILGI